MNPWSPLVTNKKFEPPTTLAELVEQYHEILNALEREVLNHCMSPGAAIARAGIAGSTYRAVYDELSRKDEAARNG